LKNPICGVLSPVGEVPTGNQTWPFERTATNEHFDFQGFCFGLRSLVILTMVWNTMYEKREGVCRLFRKQISIWMKAFVAGEVDGNLQKVVTINFGCLPRAIMREFKSFQVVASSGRQGPGRHWMWVSRVIRLYEPLLWASKVHLAFLSFSSEAIQQQCPFSSIIYMTGKQGNLKLFRPICSWMNQTPYILV
jgi:hypothetical protein